MNPLHLPSGVASPNLRQMPALRDPQLPAPSFDFNPSLPFPDPQRAEVSDRFIDDVLLNLHLHTRTHRAIDDSDNEGPEDAPEGDAVEAPDSVDPGTNDFGDGEDVDTEGDVDPCEGNIVDWDTFAEELGEFETSSLHIPGLTGVFVLRRVLYLGPRLKYHTSVRDEAQEQFI